MLILNKQIHLPLRVGSWVSLALPDQLTDSSRLYFWRLQPPMAQQVHSTRLRKSIGQPGCLCGGETELSPYGLEAQGVGGRCGRGKVTPNRQFLSENFLCMWPWTVKRTIWNCLCCSKANTWSEHKLLNSSSWSRNRRITGIFLERGKNPSQRPSYIYGRVLRSSCSDIKRS